MATTSFSIRKAQTDALVAMFSLNRVDGDGNSGQSAWKVLIYDDFCRDIISPLLNIGQLRENGITLHLGLHTKRLPIDDVPAIYFVAPTEDNVERLCKDLKESLYDQFHVNFAGSTPRALLERLAESALESDSVALVTKVHDQYLGFQSLAPTLFTLAMPNSYMAFNDARVSDAQAQANVERCVDGLFAALAVSGVVPVIRCPRNGAAEMVARTLSLRLNEHIVTRAAASLGSSAALSSFRRPLLVLLERGVDIASMVHHPWTYGAMVHDVLGMRSNRVRLPPDDADPATTTTATANASDGERVFDLDARDQFWSTQGGATFQQVAVEVKQQLADHKTKLARLDAIRNGNPSTSDSGATTSELGGFVSELPDVLAKIANVEAHTNIATSLLKQIKRRELDRFYSLEESLLARGSCDKVELRHLLTNNVGTLNDRVRLLIVYYLCAVERAAAGSTIVQEFAEFQRALADAGADLAPLSHVRQSRAHLTALSVPNAASNNSADDDDTKQSGDSASWSSLHRGYDTLASFTSLFAGGVDRLKALLPREQELPVTRIVRALMEQRALKGIEQYLYFDPNADGGRVAPLPASLAPSSSGVPTSPFREAFVFIVGGGNYTEYQNLLELASGNNSKRAASSGPPIVPNKTIVYGCTELLNSDEMLEQLKALADKK